MRISPISRYLSYVAVAASTQKVEAVASVAKIQLAPSNPGREAVVLAQSLLELIEKQKHEKITKE